MEEPINFKHVGSCDNAKNVQAFLRARDVPVLFYKVQDMKHMSAFNVLTGSPDLVPSAQFCVAGWPCDTFSKNNNTWSSHVDDFASKSGDGYDAVQSMCDYLSTSSVVFLVGENVQG